MIGRNMRGIRHASIKARVGLAAAVLAGGGAIGAVAVAASNSTSPAARNAGYTMIFQHRMSTQQALSTALSSWTTSRGKSMQAMAAAPVRNFATARTPHGTVAMQRGVVALATRHWLLVKSSNNTLHLWLLTARTQVMNVAASALGTAAMTGSAPATSAAMQNNMAPAAATMAGTRNVAAMNTTGFRPVTFNVAVAGTNVMLTITITPSTATVMPTTMSAAQTMASQAGTPMTMMPAKQPTFMAARQIARGDLVMVTGLMRHHFLWAQVVLFSKRPVAVTAPPTGMPTGSATMTPTMSPSMTPSMKPSTMMPTVSPAPSATPTTPMPPVTTTPPPFGGTHA